MALTEAERLIILGAKIIGATKEDAAAIILALKDSQQQQELLMEWLDENLETATVSDLIGETMEIMKK